MRRFKTVTYRPLPDDNIRKYGRWITGETFSCISDKLSPDMHAKQLTDLLISKLDEMCPKQTMRVSYQDKLFINKELKTLNRRKQRAYVKNGTSLKYKRLKNEFDIKYKIAAEKYMRNKIDELKETQPGKAYNVLKNMGAQPGDCSEDQTFTLPVHQDLNLNDQQCAEKIAEHFASISQEYRPLNVNLLPERVRARIGDGTNPPIITEHECYDKLKKSKKPKAVFLGTCLTPL